MSLTEIEEGGVERIDDEDVLDKEISADAVEPDTFISDKEH